MTTQVATANYTITNINDSYRVTLPTADPTVILEWWFDDMESAEVFVSHDAGQTNPGQCVTVTTEEMSQALLTARVFIGGLTDEGIEHYYRRMVKEGRITA